MSFWLGSIAKIYNIRILRILKSNTPNYYGGRDSTRKAKNVLIATMAPSVVQSAKKKQKNYDFDAEICKNKKSINILIITVDLLKV